MADYIATTAIAGFTPKDDPSTPSTDAREMANDQMLIADILEGATNIRNRGVRYLPKFQKESEIAYRLRLQAAPWRPEFSDALRSLCSKPFSKEVGLNADAPTVFLGEVVDEKTKKREGGLIDDIDGEGNSLHVFARETFANGVAYGFDAIYVTHTNDEPAAPTIAAETEAGARPYWVHVRARDIIAVLWKKLGARKMLAHIRWRECESVQDGFAETAVERIRVLELNAADLPTWQTYTKDKRGKYVQDAPPQLLAGVTDIPVVLFFTGERSDNYRTKPPMIDLAHMQIELYQALSRKERILTLAGFPMLKAKGMRPPDPTPQVFSDANVYDRNVLPQSGSGLVIIDPPAPQIEVGPGVVLFAPPVEGIDTDWDYVQPNAANITEVRDDVNSIMEDFRRLAMQPRTPKSGNMVATGLAIEASKSHSSIEVWANGLADAINQSLVYTCQWLKIPDTVTCSVHTDFGVDVQGTEEAKAIGDAQSRGVVSRQTEREELARRGILGPQFDEDEEEQRIAEEEQSLQPEAPIDPRTGKPLQIDPLTGMPKAPAMPPGKKPPGGLPLQ